MKYFLSRFFLIISFFLPFSLYAFDVPVRPNAFVQDYAKILSADQVKDLENKIEAFEKSTTNEIAVVTVPTLDGDTVENLAQEIFTKWGIGKKDKNNGVLLLVSLAERKTRIHTGYGVEGDLTDLGTSYIQQEVIVPAFQAGDYYAGINGAVDKMITALGGNTIVPEDYNVPQKSSKISWNFIFFLVIIVFQILVAILAPSKSWWAGGVLGGVAGLIIWHFFIASIVTAVFVIIALIGGGLFFDFIVSRAYRQKSLSGRYPWWFGGGGGFGGGSGGGGGFGGFGGGSSGGGGSSSSW